jgi:hypothetical protein
MNLVLLLSILFIRFHHRFLPVAFEKFNWIVPGLGNAVPHTVDDGSNTVLGAVNANGATTLTVCPDDTVSIVLCFFHHDV